jgi:hypothetical protein
MRAWEGSLHRRSFSDPLFQSGYRVDHRAFCRDCHAPRHEGEDPRPGSAAYEEGVTCTECHVERGPHPSSAPGSGLRTRACGDCHEFHFPPSRRGFDPGELMQRTASEHRASGRSESCADCHLRDHSFAVRRDDIAGAIAIEGTLTVRGGTTELVVRLANAGAGHAIPTGDVLRALELHVWPANAPEAIQSRALTRTFGTALRLDAHGVGARLVEREDSRVPPSGAREERFVFPGAIDGAGFRLEYLRANRRNAAIQGLTPSQNVLVLHEGTIRR